MLKQYSLSGQKHSTKKDFTDMAEAMGERGEPMQSKRVLGGQLSRSLTAQQKPQ